MKQYGRSKVVLALAAVIGLALGLCVALAMLMTVNSLQDEAETSSAITSDTATEYYVYSDSPEN